MPRYSLPKECKALRTIPVCITVHTEDDLWNHVMQKLEEYIPEADLIFAKQNDFINFIHDKNPYEGFSWRNGRTPSRVKFDDWRKDSDEYMDMIAKHYEIKHDFHLCAKIFGWNTEEHEKFGDYGYWSFEMLHKHCYSRPSTEDEFKIIEENHYMNSKKQWEITDAEWITENKLEKDHKQYHRSLEYNKAFYENEMRDLQSYPESFKQRHLERLTERFPNGPIDTRDLINCKYCINDDIKQKEFEAREKMNEEQLRIHNEKYRQQMEEERKEREANRELYKCETCNFETYDEALAEKHEDSKEHKKAMDFAKYYCKTCSIQCRNLSEYMFHTKTQKHLNNVRLTPKSFNCEACQYETLIKQNYEKHCSTKKHQAKVSETKEEV